MGDEISSHAKAFRGKYLIQLDDDIKQLEALGTDSGEERPFRERVIKIHYFAHKIAGSAATFGLESSSRSARVLEDLADAIPETSETFVPGVGEEILNLIGALRHQHSDAVSGDALKRDAETRDGASHAPYEASRRVIAVCGGPVFSERVSEDFARLGYGLRRVDTADALAVFADGSQPAGILIWLDVLSGPGSEEAMAKMLSQVELSTIPVLFVSDSDGYEARARAVKAGGDGFLLAPLDAVTCDRKIGEIGSEKALPAPRLLIVGGARNLHSRLSLESDPRDFSLCVLESPREILRGMAEFRPDVLLVELDLSGCTGFDLAKVVLQADAATAVPIIFVGSSDRDAEIFRQVGLERDEFVIAPCEPDMVARAVRRRIAEQRSPEAKHAQRLRLGSMLDRRTLFAIAAKAEVSSAVGSYQIETCPQDADRSKQPLVLVVDDDRLLTEAIQAALVDEGFDVLCAHDGEEAFHIAFAEEPDLILSDYNMPGGSGGHLCRRLNDSVVTRDIPTIIMTRKSAYGGKNYALEREMLGRAGVAAFLTKPIDFGKLIPEIRRQIAAVSAKEPVLAD